MARLELEITDTLSDDMDELRLLCFPLETAVVTSRDEFDNRSSHLTIRIEGVIAAYGRLTPGPSAVFESWTKGRAQIPTGTMVADLGRCLVSPLFRGLGLFTLICLEGLILAAERGFIHIVGAVIPRQKHAAALYAIGFRDSGSVVDGQDSGGHYYEAIQPLLADSRDFNHWKSQREIAMNELASKGYESSSGRQ